MVAKYPPGSVLGACGPSGMARLSEHWIEHSYPAQAPIVSAEDTDTDVFFVLAGLARAATYTQSGKEIRLSDLPPGSVFGIFAAIDNLPRSTNVIAAEPSRIARMSAAQFNEIVDSETTVMRALLAYLVDRVRDVSTRMTDVTALNAEQPLINELIRLAEPDPDNPDRAVIKNLPTQQELATLIFSQREAVARDMSRLAKAGLIERTGRSLVIISLNALKRRLEE